MRIAFCIISAFAFAFASSVAAQINPPERPIVFVPGIVGSVLSDSDGEIVWGNLASLRGSRFERLNLLPENGEAERLVASDILRAIPLVFGAFEIGLYGDLVEFLTGEEGRLASRAVSGQVGEYVEGETLFVFPYDWRRSNFANARALNDFIEDNIPSGEYDLIAHSMGGLVTRIMLSGRAPAPLCTDPRAQTQLSHDDLWRVCDAIYGTSPDGQWPSEAFVGPYSATDRLHAFYEIAVPHYGSVNVASTYADGWGLLTDILIGSKRDLQNIILSMASPWELVPTYANCCARGAEGEAGRFPVPQPDLEYWLTYVLAFGGTTCPYTNCALKEEIARNGLENRAIIDDIMGEGLPRSVDFIHVIIGRQVRETRETMYIAQDSTGDGDGLTFRVGPRGDGTVHEESARLPDVAQNGVSANNGFAERVEHGFIAGDEQITTYIYNTLINRVRGRVQAVAAPVLPFSGGTVRDIGLIAEPNILLPGIPFDIRLTLTQDQSRPFDRDRAQSLEPRISFALLTDSSPASTNIDATRVSPLRYDAEASLPVAGYFEYTEADYVLEAPGIYEITVADPSGQPLGKRFVFVLEEE